MKKSLLFILIIILFTLTGCINIENIDDSFNYTGKNYNVKEIIYKNSDMSSQLNWEMMVVQISEDFRLNIDNFTNDYSNRFDEFKLTNSNFDDYFPQTNSNSWKSNIASFQEIRNNNLLSWKAINKYNYDISIGEVEGGKQFYYLLKQKNKDLYIVCGTDNDFGVQINYIFNLEECIRKNQVEETVKKQEEEFKKSYEISGEYYRKLYYPCEIKVSLTLTDEAGTIDSIIGKYELDRYNEIAKIEIKENLKLINFTFAYNDYTNEVNDYFEVLKDDNKNFSKIEINTIRKYNFSYLQSIDKYIDEYEEVDFSSNIESHGNYDLLELFINSTFDNYDEFYQTLTQKKTHFEEKNKDGDYKYQINYIDELLKKYDIIYFENNLLVITDMINTGSWSQLLTVDNVYFSNETLYIVIRTDNPSAEVCAVQTALFNISISNDYKDKISKIVTLD